MPRYQPPDYIDNKADRKLGHVLNKLILEQDETTLDVASGFFEPNVWHILGEALEKLKNFRLLLGRPPELSTDDPKVGVVDLGDFYRDQLRTNLEGLPLKPEYVALIDSLIQFLYQEHVAVRFYKGRFLHAKAYLLDTYAIVGSSNFTPSGMQGSNELNLTRQDRLTIQDLRRNWFEPLWAESDDHKATLINMLAESKFGNAPWTPHDIFIKVLYEYFKDRFTPDAAEARMGVELASFQKEGLNEAIRLIDRHGGVIVSDAVGLGKTYIGMGLLENYIINKRQKGFIPHGVVICPAQLRDLVWIPKLNEYGIKADVISQESVSRDDFNWREFNDYDVVLIDESHNFRNPNSKRYQNLMKMLATGKKADKRVILMTATPINNTIWDLYHQVAFITRGQNAFFREYGIRNLKQFFGEVQNGGADMFTLLEQIMVRRSRLDVIRRQEAGEVITLPGKGEIRFPQRHLHSVEYDLTTTYDGFYETIVNLIDSLSLISFNIEKYRTKGVDKEVENKRNYSEALIQILKTLYLKRLESSLAAFKISITRQRDFQDRFYNMLVEKGVLLDSATNRRLLALEALDENSSEKEIEELIDELPEADIREYDLRELRAELSQDRATLNKILDMIERAQGLKDESKRDAKLTEVKNLLGGQLCGEKVLMFTYYQDTAKYVYEALCNDKEWQASWGDKPPVIEVIHGSTHAEQRKSFVKRFAPVANDAEPLDPSEIEIDILISTDVLSEGQNLQDAGVIINYDLHWTPIRMIQRAGRIDRLGTAFEALHIFNCFPQAGLEKLLGLVKRLQNRIMDINRTVGLDASVLGEVISARSLEQLRRMQIGDQSVIDELEQDSELVSTDEMKLPLMLYYQQVGENRIKNIPRGIGSGMAKRAPRPTGVFFAFQANDRHFWRLYTPTGEVFMDKRRLFQYLQANPEEPRVMPADFSVYELLDKATKDVLREINSAFQAQQIPKKMGALNLELTGYLTQVSLFDQEEADPALLEKVRRTLQDVPIDAFRKDKKLKAIKERHTSDKNQKVLVEALDEFFIENDLYRDVIVVKDTKEQIDAENLQLIAYEVFG